MTTEEKLSAIKAKCLEIIALGEKRTPGKWYLEAHAIDTVRTHPNGGDWIADAYPRNSPFIAALAAVEKKLGL